MASTAGAAAAAAEGFAGSCPAGEGCGPAAAGLAPDVLVARAGVFSFADALRLVFFFGLAIFQGNAP